MFGVVLWSCKDERKAVIWCEDHGDLAFYNGGRDSVFNGDSLDAGDLVSFHMSETRNMRVATDPQLVAEQQYPEIADNLTANGAARPAKARAAFPSLRRGHGENVISFVPHRGATRKAS